jgi:hypothetical protein
VDHQPRRLVHDQKVLVLERDLQRNVLRLVVGRRRLRDLYANIFVPTNLGRGIAKELARALDGSASDQSLEALS